MDQQLVDAPAVHVHDFEAEAAPAEAKSILPKKISPQTEVKQLAAWTTVSRVLLNLDETITRE